MKNQKLFQKRCSDTFLLGLLFSALALTSPLEVSACETTSVTFSGVIDSRASETSALCPTITSFSELNSSAALAHTVVIYDSTNKARNVHLGFFKGSSSDWRFCAYLEGLDTRNDSSTFDAYLAGNLLFSDSGYSAAPATFTVSVTWFDGATSLVSFSLFPLLVAPVQASSLTEQSDGGTGGCESSSKVDFDRDGHDDFVTFASQTGTWSIRISASQALTKRFGKKGDFPLAGDYTGDGKADLVLYRPSTGRWYLCSSESSLNCSAATSFRLGNSSDKPVRADFDGDNILDFVVWRPSIKSFLYRESRTTGVALKTWGSSRFDTPVVSVAK